ncbi:hypothetical protein [Neptunicella sp.]|uniref:hypothetical protein n=1 Tax=Neptunicella sp. TaxID=2125986 RepID=UPI003F68E17A
MWWILAIGVLLGVGAAIAIKPDIPKNNTGGIDVTRPATDNPINVVLGKQGRISGTIAFQNTNDGNRDDVQNDLLHRIIVWGERVTTLGQIYLNDLPINNTKFNASDGGRWAYRVAFPNALNGYSDPRLNAAGYSPTRHKFTGLACDYLRCQWDGEGKAFNSEPVVTVDVDEGHPNINIYDQTVTWSENAASALLTVLKNPDWGYGYTLASNKIDQGSFTDAIAKCAELVPLFDGSEDTRRKYTCNYLLETDRDITDHIDVLLNAMNAHMPNIDGKYHLIIEGDDDPEAFELIEGETFFGDVATTEGGIDRYNRIICEYLDPDKNWKSQEVIFPEKDSALDLQWLAEDNGVRMEKRVKLPATIYYYEALQQAKFLAYRSREALNTKLTANIDADVLNVGQVVNVTRPSVGWVQKPFRVLEKTTKNSTLQVELYLVEHQPYLYDIDFGASQPPIPDTINPTAGPADPTGLTVTPLYNNDGQLEISWTSTSSIFDVQIYKIVGETEEVISTATIRTKSYIIKGLAVGSYELDVRAKNNLGELSNFVTQSFGIGVLVTPVALPNVNAVPGSITLEPPTPYSASHIYEFRWHNSDDTTVRYYGQSLVCVLPNIIDDVTYTIEYRLISPEGAAENWVSIDIDGVEQTLYTWLAYADDDTGTGISLDPTGKAYYGVATGRTVATASIADPAIYTWLPQAAGGGEPAISGWLSNTVHAVSVAPDGTGGDFSGAATTISIYVGLVDDSAAWSISASASSGVTGSLTGRTYTVSAMSLDQGYVDLTATREGYSDITQRFTIVKLRTGADGAAGVPGAPGTDGTTTFTWIRYANNAAGSGISNDPAGKAYIGFAYNKTTATESTDPEDYTWSKILGDDGQDGQDGIQGPPGADGTPRYTWIRYANNATGSSGFSNSPTGRTYIGIATNKTTATESTNPADYTWSKYVGDDGPQGVPGTPGADGTPRYTWIKYADNASGSGISNNPTGKAYIGFAYNKTTSAESSTPGDYAWSKILGEDGSDGQDGIQGPPGADGTPRYTWIKYADNGSGSGLSNNPTGKKYIGIATNKTTATESNSAGDYTWSKYVGEDGVDGQDGQDGGIGPPGPPGPIATARSYSDSGSSNSLPGGSWQTLVNLSVPAGTWDFDMEVQANASNVTLVTLKVRWLKNGSVNGGYEDTDISKFPSVSLSYHNVSTISAASYQLQVYASNYVDSGSASGYLTAVEQL